MHELLPPEEVEAERQRLLAVSGGYWWEVVVAS